jgi:hypothetical protein
MRSRETSKVPAASPTENKRWFRAEVEWRGRITARKIPAAAEPATKLAYFRYVNSKANRLAHSRRNRPVNRNAQTTRVRRAVMNQERP